MVLDRIASRMTDYIVPVSPALEDYMRNVVKLKSCKIDTIPNGIDTDHFSPKEKDRNILEELNLGEDVFILGNVARLAAVKDQETMIKAFH